MNNSNQNQNHNQKKIFTLNASSEQEGFSIRPIADGQIVEYFSNHLYSLSMFACHTFAQLLLDDLPNDLYFVEYDLVDDGGVRAVLFIPQSQYSLEVGGFNFSCPNYFQGFLDELSAGIVLSLYAYSHLSMQLHPSNDSSKVSHMFHIIRELALTFEDDIQSKIFRAID